AANIFVGLRTPQGTSELDTVIKQLEDAEYPVVDLSEDEMAKQHVRYMVGGRPAEALQERLFSFEFPEHPGALQKFLLTLGMNWNITLFHYRNHGAAYGRVLTGFELPDGEMKAFSAYLVKLGYQYKEETNNPAYKFFLAH
ncbi:MAG: threonine dehydratase, partial [Moritella dasanensis]